jgi:menaquinone-dependent protoporphyrinogen oxidase
MKQVLVTYATMAGSTAEVAKVIGEELEKSGLQVEVLPINQVHDLGGYDGVIVGGPMIMGWHRAALGSSRKIAPLFNGYRLRSM